MIAIRILLLLVFLFLAPALLGIPWTALLPPKGRYRQCAFFPIGFFVELAIFQLMTLPAAFFHLPFTLLCRLYAGILAVTCIASGIYIRLKRPFTVRLPRLTPWERFYLIIFLGLLCIQLYNGFSRDTTVWSYDDAAYVPYAEDAIRYNEILAVSPYTGIVTAFNIHRALQGWLYYPAFLSLVSSIPVTVMERTVLETYDILLAWVVYAYMASVVFRNKENGLIFLIILSVLHIYGWYSQYSVSFRLLGPNYQGKAVLSVSLFPLLFTLLIQILNRPYSWKNAMLMLLLSEAASSLTLFGAVTVVLNIVLVVGLSVLRKKRRWKNLGYIPWGALLPALHCGIYFLYKYGLF